MSSTLPFSNGSEAFVLSVLCLKEKVRSPPRLKEAMGAF
jgi:hypothetical protein